MHQKATTQNPSSSHQVSNPQGSASRVARIDLGMPHKGSRLPAGEESMCVGSRKTGQEIGPSLGILGGARAAPRGPPNAPNSSGSATSESDEPSHRDEPSSVWQPAEGLPEPRQDPPSEPTCQDEQRTTQCRTVSQPTSILHQMTFIPQTSPSR